MLVARSIGGNREAWGSPHASFYESWKEERWAWTPSFRCWRGSATSSLRSPADLGLDLYDLEQRGGTLRITLDTPAGADVGVTLDVLALASRLMSKELDQHDPIPSRYTLEVTSPGVERALRISAHFQREVGKLVAIRLANVEADQRRVQGVIVAADDDAVTIHVDDGDRRIAYADIDRAKTVFEWGGQPKPGSKQRVSEEGQ